MASASDRGPAMSVQGLRRSSSVTRSDEEAARRIFETCNRRDMCLGLKDAHFDVHDLKHCGFDAADLKFAGFSASQLKSVGLDAKTQRLMVRAHAVTTAFKNLAGIPS